VKTAEIEVMQRELLRAVADIGGIAGNLDEAIDWSSTHPGEARLSLEAADLGIDDAIDRLATIQRSIRGKGGAA
jgi:hypothetical protein